MGEEQGQGSPSPCGPAPALNPRPWVGGGTRKRVVEKRAGETNVRVDHPGDFCSDGESRPSLALQPLFSGQRPSYLEKTIKDTRGHDMVVGDPDECSSLSRGIVLLQVVVAYVLGIQEASRIQIWGVSEAKRRVVESGEAHFVRSIF